MNCLSYLLANTVIAIHAALVLVVIMGIGSVFTGQFSRLPSWFQYAFYTSLAGVALSDLLVGDCILTIWEKWLWNHYRAGSGYDGAFIANYLPLLSGVIERYGALIIVCGGGGRAAFLAQRRWHKER